MFLLVFYLTKDSPKGDLQGIYHLNELKTELEAMGSKVHLIKADLNNPDQVKKIIPFDKLKESKSIQLVSKYYQSLSLFLLSF